MSPTTALLLLTALVRSSSPAPSRSSRDSFSMQRNLQGGDWPTREYVRVERLHVRSRVRHRYASTTITSFVVNTGNSSHLAQFSVLLPESAFVTSFVLEVGGKVYKSFVKERQEGKAQTGDPGLAAGHLAVSAKDSHHFYTTVSLEAGAEANFTLGYEELLRRRLGLYSHVLSLFPGQVVPDLRVVIEISENRPLTNLSVLPFQSAHYDSPHSKGDNLVWEEVRVQRPTPSQAELVFTPSVETQQKLSLDAGEGLAGQLAVRYDVDNPSPGGTILVGDGYFVHWLGPAGLPPLRKHVVFTLDVSGSMTGHKLRQLKQALLSILDDLHPQDYFNIIEFSYSVTVWNLDALSSSAVIQPELHSSGLWWFNKAELPSTMPPSTEPPPLPPTVPPYPATPEYVRKAKDVIDKMTAGGGTNIHGALKTAVLAAASSFTNTSFDATSAKPEPIIIFLTDGDATIGITEPDKILSMVKSLNVKRSAIFSVGLGDSADLSLLRRLSLANNGFARSITETADAAQQLRHFFREVASPLLANISCSYGPAQITSMTRHSFHTLYQGSELVVAGRLPPHVSPLTVTAVVTALTAHGNTTYFAQSEDEERKWKGENIMERLWAQLTIRQQLDDPTEQLLPLALKYNFVTPVTSLVVVKPNQSVEIDHDSLKPQSLLNRFYANNKLSYVFPGATRMSSFAEESTTNKMIQSERLSLEDLRWPEGLIDLESATVTLPLGVNGTNQQYRLGVQQEDWPLGDCVSPQNELSHCRHLPHCVLPDIVASVANYIRYYCPLANGFAGICCPDTRHSLLTTERSQTTTGDTLGTTTDLLSLDTTSNPQV